MGVGPGGHRLLVLLERRRVGRSRSKQSAVHKVGRRFCLQGSEKSLEGLRQGSNLI